MKANILICERLIETGMKRTLLKGSSGIAAQEFHYILLNLEVYYSVHYSPTVLPIISQFNPVHISF